MHTGKFNAEPSDIPSRAEGNKRVFIVAHATGTGDMCGADGPHDLYADLHMCL